MIIDEKLVNDFRKKHNLSKAQFCKKCGISVNTLKKMNGRSRYTTLVKIAIAMNESTDNLLGLDHISRSKR